MFVRKKCEPLVPLITMEIYAGRLRQALGIFNSKIKNHDEKDFITKFTEQKGIVNMVA